MTPQSMAIQSIADGWYEKSPNICGLKSPSGNQRWENLPFTSVIFPHSISSHGLVPTFPSHVSWHRSLDAATPRLSTVHPRDPARGRSDRSSPGTSATGDLEFLGLHQMISPKSCLKHHQTPLKHHAKKFVFWCASMTEDRLLFFGSTR